MTENDADQVTGAAVLEELVALFSDVPGVENGTMFRSPGLRVHGKIFAFLGHEHRLLVKIPRDEADDAVARGEATEVVMGTRRMKEWIAYPVRPDHGQTLQTWEAAARRAHAYVSRLAT
jgi:hypothetical protein